MTVKPTQLEGARAQQVPMEPEPQVAQTDSDYPARQAKRSRQRENSSQVEPTQQSADLQLLLVQPFELRKRTQAKPLARLLSLLKNSETELASAAPTEWQMGRPGKLPFAQDD